MIRLLALFTFFPLLLFAQEQKYDYVIFRNSLMEGNYYFSRTDFKAPSNIANIDGKLPVADSFFTPGNALLLKIKNSKEGRWTAIVYRESIRGQDHFAPAKFVGMHIMQNGGTAKTTPAFAYQLIFADSSLSDKVPVYVRSRGEWEHPVTPLTYFKISEISDVQKIIGIQFLQYATDDAEYEYIIDDVELLPEAPSTTYLPSPILINSQGYPKHVDLEWSPLKTKDARLVKIYRSTDSMHFIPIGVQLPVINRYTDYTGETGKKYYYKSTLLDDSYQESFASQVVSATTKPLDDEAFLSMIQEACFRYYWDGAESNSGLAKEDIPGRQNMVASGASGFGILALIAGTERSFITREQSVERFLKIADFLSTAEKFHGAFSHFIDGPTGKVEPFFGPRDNGGDLVETSFLMQGLLAARQYFDSDDAKEKIIREKITALWEGVEWDWYRRFPDNKYLFWHWSPDKAWIINHQLIGWNETMVTYLLAIASPTHGVPASMYYTGWASQDKIAKEYRINWGGTKDGSEYANGHSYFGIKLEVGVSNGGPLFFTHYAYLGYDPHAINDAYTNYFSNNQNIALINYRYCLQNPNQYQGYGDSCWGLTASDGPRGYSADEPIKSRDLGKIAPTGAVSSFPYTPAESMKALKNYYYNYGKFLWGEYGFRDAFDLTHNWCSPIYMGLNQAPMVVMIENYRTGLLWKLFMQNEEIQKGLEKIRMEKK